MTVYEYLVDGKIYSHSFQGMPSVKEVVDQIGLNAVIVACWYHD